MLAIDLTHSAHSRAQTGIQQVSRGLLDAMTDLTDAEAIVYDRFARAWRRLDGRERRHLKHVDSRKGVRRKRAHWSTWQRLRGRWLANLRGKRLVLPPEGRYRGLLVPEFFGSDVGPWLPALRERIGGPAVAIFHDAIAFRHPELGMPETTKRFPQYLRELAQFDAVAAVSEASADELRECWARLDLHDPPPVHAVQLGLRRPPQQRPLMPAGPRPDCPELLMVATLETRKNHEALLKAAETLWQEGLSFAVHLVGMPHAVTGKPVVAQVKALQEAGYPLIWEGGLNAAALEERYRQCWATVFPSHLEGFGLPVLESLDYGKPAITTDRGGLNDFVHHGGCLVVEPNAHSVETALRRLLTEPELHPCLCDEAANRPIRTMHDFAADLRDLLDQLATAKSAGRP
ncbi:MAG: group 1 glycosyl transferase [Puniceicoccaceae bacterium 5H]|nr:MAG: group 1 glycosyl transferase [Puniceicoccaceae bacterium 5H]